ncbi:MAG: hypothetical protein ACYS7Y_34710 [Planctomycetota bacterium]|jgi:hypothetical protein
MQITFNIPDDQVFRVKDWMRKETDPGIDPDTELPNPPLTDAELLAEFKRKLQRWIKGEVQQFELLKQHEDIFATYTQIDIQD